MVTRKPFGPPLSTTPASSSKKDASPNPPYPTTPPSDSTSPVLTALDRAKTIHSAKSVYSPDLNKSPAFDLIDMHQAQQRPRRDSDVSSHGTWNSEEDEEDEERDGTPENDAAAEVPKPLTVRKSQQDINQQAQPKEEVPSILRPGPAGGRQAQTRKSQEEMLYEDEAQGNPWASPTTARPGLIMGAGGIPASTNPYRQQNGLSAEASGAWMKEQRAPLPPANAPPAPPPAMLLRHRQ